MRRADPHRAIRARVRATLLPAAQRVPRQWLNGRGETLDVASEPAGAPWDAIDWRVSTARLCGTAPFSSFVGIDRTLAMLRGTLELRIAGRAAETLSPASAAVTFPGEAAAEGTVLAPVADGDVALDLNVMTRRGKYRAAVERMLVESTRDLPIGRSTATLLVASAPLRVGIAGEDRELATLDALLIRTEADLHANVTSRDPAALWCVVLERAVTDPAGILCA